MAIHIAWDDDEKQVIRYIFDEHWTWEEFFIAKTQANRLMDTVSHKIGVIIDTPPNMAPRHNTLSNARNAIRTRHPNTVIVVLVVTRPFLRTMIYTLKSIVLLGHLRIESAATLDEARALVHQHLRTDQVTA